MLVLFRETLGSHGRVGQVPDYEDAPEHGEAAIGDEDGLPGFEGAAAGDQGEAVREQAADDLLCSVLAQVVSLICGKGK